MSKVTNYTGLFYLFATGEVTPTDYTSHILVPTYEVNEDVKYKEYRDSLGIYHRYPMDNNSTHISGSFEMLFTDNEDLDRFVEKFNKYNYYRVVVFLNNKFEWHDTHLYVTIEFQNDRPYMSKKHDSIKVKVED